MNSALSAPKIKAAEPAIRLEHVTFAYNSHPVLEDINLEVMEQDFFGIIGPNGGGKTTILRIILGLLKPQAGSVTVLGAASSTARKHVGYVPQHSSIDKDFPLEVRDIVAMGTVTSQTFFPWFSKESRDTVLEAMEQVGIGMCMRKRFGELSGGQRQRCLIARALASKPSILLLDEPTASVDAVVEKDIFELFHSLNERLTIILVSHDLGFISSYVNKIACVNRRLVYHGVSEVSWDTLMKEAYQGGMSMIHHRCGL